MGRAEQLLQRIVERQTTEIEDMINNQIVEELFFRGLLLRALLGRTRPPVAVVVSDFKRRTGDRLMNLND